MTITRRWQAGAESNGTSSHEIEFDAEVGVSTSNSQKRTGTYSFQVNGSNFATVYIPATYQIRVGLHVKGPSGNGGNVFVRWRTSSAELGRLASNTDEDMLLYVDNVLKDTETNAFPEDVWAHFGINIKIDGTNGWVSVYKNGTKILSFAGDTGSDQIEELYFGGFSASSMSFFDDVFVDDTTNESDGVVPDYRFEYITPNAVGNYSQCDINPDGGEEHYEDVDDRPHDSDTTYVEADAINEKDTYGMTTFVLEDGWGITAVIPVAIAKKSDAGVATQIALMARHSSDDTIGSAQDLPESYGIMWERIVNCPGETGWTQAQLDAVEVGFEGRGTF